MLAVTYPWASASSFVTTAGDATPLWEDVTDPTCSGDRHRASASSYLSSQATRASSKIRVPCTNCVMCGGKPSAGAKTSIRFTGANCATNAAEGLLHIYGELPA